MILVAGSTQTCRLRACRRVMLSEVVVPLSESVILCCQRLLIC
jgi:hypothetical protein